MCIAADLLRAAITSRYVSLRDRTRTEYSRALLKGVGVTALKKIQACGSRIWSSLLDLQEIW